MIDIFLFPLLAAALAMLFSNRCLVEHDFPMSGLFTVVVGIVAFGVVFLLSMLYVFAKVALAIAF